jgi:hypothetical protein
VTAAARSGGGTPKLLLIIGAVVGALLVIGVLSVDQGAGEPFDPTSTGPEGTKALVELTERFGARVSIPATFPVDADVAIAFRDEVPRRAEEDVRHWVETGHTLIVADPFSGLSPPADYTSPVVDTVARGDCDIAALAHVDTLALGPSPALLRYDTDGDVAPCFADGGGAYVAERAAGSGLIVGLAGGEVFQNRNLDERDNAVLATALLAPRPGTRVAVLTKEAFPGPKGDPSVGDAIGRLIEEYPRVGFVLIQIGIALGVLAVVRARRVGRPVTEPQPVAIAGSSLVDATGRMLRQRRDPEAAARVLRAEARRTVAERAALPATAPTAVLAEALAARTGRSPQESWAVLDGPPVTSDADLVALADQIDHVVEEVSHGRAP